MVVVKVVDLAVFLMTVIDWNVNIVGVVNTLKIHAGIFMVVLQISRVVLFIGEKVEVVLVVVALVLIQLHQYRDVNESDSMQIVVHLNSAHLFSMYIRIRLLSEQIFVKHVRILIW